ncbi:g10660 [Coccomyxa viridis]|uniref:G10660 protein n=1 Tax=Coccomyxa viridis TaxID=1274662 RepID=A0ABP1G5V3_9CHLO
MFKHSIVSCESHARAPIPVSTGIGLAAAAFLSSASPAVASTKIGEFTASGFLFKDSVELVTVEDPEVEGVTVYISDFKRSLADKLSKNFFSEPSQASVTCAATGPVRIKDIKRISGPEGGEVFSEQKGLNFFQNKTLRVRRVYDQKHNTLVYTAYATRFQNSGDGPSAGRYRTSVCALPISPVVSPAAAAGES